MFGVGWGGWWWEVSGWGGGLDQVIFIQYYGSKFKIKNKTKIARGGGLVGWGLE